MDENSENTNNYCKKSIFLQDETDFIRPRVKDLFIERINLKELESYFENEQSRFINELILNKYGTGEEEEIYLISNFIRGEHIYFLIEWRSC